MSARDEDNVDLAESTEKVDAINADFYGRFQFPWAPGAFDSPTDPCFETIMLNQSIGSWDHSTVPTNPRIWVAGCGTNQAVFTALRFPNGNILCTDLSLTSLQTSAAIARQLGISNLEFKQESINNSNYLAEFDYVICTGVIHHNADPRLPLAKLANALKGSGILELMVYNRYHRIETTAFQKAIRVFAGSERKANYSLEMQIAEKIIPAMNIQNSMAEFLENYKDCPESKLADALLQPVEYSYTVKSLEALAESCGLVLLTPCVNQFDMASRNLFWNMEFTDRDLQDRYDSLPDSQRWQITNYLLLERSPMLWFYLQRKDSGRKRKSEVQVSNEFLDQKFEKANTRKKVYIKSEQGNYLLSDRLRPCPSLHVDNLSSKIVALIAKQPRTTMRDVLNELGQETSFLLTNKLRLFLTTNAFPFLVATANGV